MRRTLSAVACAAALVVAYFVVPHAGAAIDPRPSPPGPYVAPPIEVPAGMLAAMQRDLNLTPAQVRDRLTAERDASAIEKGLKARLGSTYGGSWVRADGRLMVAVTSADAAQTVRTAGAEPAVVARGMDQLDSTRGMLDRQSKRAARGVYAWYIDPASNSVVVVADKTSTGNAFVASSGATASAVRVLAKPAEAPRPMFDIRGGDQYVINGNTLCSIGFSVAGGFVTAGHCGGVNSPTLGFNNVAQGTVRGSSFPGNDYGWVQVNGNWTSQPWVNNYAGGNVGVAGSQEAGIGASVCRSGRTTGWRCGVIQAKNVTVNYAQGAVFGLTQSNACAEGGDSGGSWISGNQAQGVTSGGSGNCTSGGTMFFQPVNEILGAFGLSLTTTGGGGGGTSRIIGFANKCIDVPNSNAVDGQFLNLWDCNGTAAQAWTFAGDGTIRAFGKCMDVAWGSRDNGAVIQIVTCSGNPAQQFVLTAAGDLVNPQSNKCVDVDAWNSNNGARLIQWDCHGGANQKWRRG